MRDLSIGIDLGTSGCRAVALDGQQHPCAYAQTDLPTSQRQDNTSTQNPEDWWNAVFSVMAALCVQIDPERVATISIDATSASVLMTDENGKPLSEGLMYDDARSLSQAHLLQEMAPVPSLTHNPTSSLAKYLYLRSRLPQARYFLHQADWITGRLLGHYGFSDENNCLKLGYDPQHQQWAAWLTTLEQAGLINWQQFPAVYPPGSILGRVHPQWQAQFGLSADSYICAGTTDSTAAFLATGASLPGEALTILGSTLVVKILSEHPVNAPEYGIYSQRLGNLWLVGGASNSGGAVLRQYFSDAQMQEMSTALRPQHSTGLDYYPLCAPGERFPVADSHYPPKLTPRPEQDSVFFQGMLEGIANIEQQAYARLQSLGAPVLKSIRSTGGGARNPAWTQIRAQKLNAPLLDNIYHETTCGAAVLPAYYVRSIST
ncbi:FGGY-family carbohydrate kinase [Candidatus Venteria ishoeyi]|uniref:FGGY-family carbohydrate kinase n=1 Tax=Candidatus Venteria ishoeyi TaxID=1899563 RepID=UPI0025A63B7B|nr:FGGY-family carbohydrate kinase [Candidatus Venteria ishoeyi]MDM8545065.1 FGGY-family carbohydrate kinase [Candidatus Venteria ishoeyi]